MRTKGKMKAATPLFLC